MGGWLVSWWLVGGWLVKRENHTPSPFRALPLSQGESLAASILVKPTCPPNASQNSWTNKSSAALFTETASSVINSCMFSPKFLARIAKNIFHLWNLVLHETARAEESFPPESARIWRTGLSEVAVMIFTSPRVLPNTGQTQKAPTDRKAHFPRRQGSARSPICRNGPRLRSRRCRIVPQ